MAVSMRVGRRELQQVFNRTRSKEGEISPERTKVWTEPQNKKEPQHHLHQQRQQHREEKVKNNGRRVVPVVYYLCRNGQLEHPHFMEVPLSSSSYGLSLRDVINRLNLLRGKGMAAQYSWSSKRSYKNGYVWHDLDVDDFIHPVQGQDYVLKGSEILEPSAPVFNNLEASLSLSSGPRKLPEIERAEDQAAIVPVRNYRRNQSWSSIDLHEYKVYKAESSGELVRKSTAADASTQTDDGWRRRQPLKDDEEELSKPGTQEEKDSGENGGSSVGDQEQHRTELSTEEISPPPSDSSPETLEKLMKADGRVVLSTVDEELQDNHHRSIASYCPSGRMKASSILMSLISCGSMSFRDCGATAGVAKHHGLSLIVKPSLPQGMNREGDEASSCSSTRFGNGKLGGDGIEEYFSGSLILETKKDEYPALKRSSSYNADRSWNMSVAEEIEGVRAKCIPRKPKSQLARKLFNSEMTSARINGAQDGTKGAVVQ